MGIYVDGSLIYVVDGDKLSTTQSLSPGKHETVVQEWDHCGGSTYTNLSVTVSGKSGIYVTSPASGSTVTSPVNYVATATTASCDKGIDSMGVYLNNQLVTKQNGASLNTQVTLGTGNQSTLVKEWDKCGGSSYVPVSLTVQSDASGGKVLSGLEQKGGWQGFGQVPPHYKDCSPCSGIDWEMWQGVSGPDNYGKSTEFKTHGSKPYAVVLWFNQVIGADSSEGIHDDDRTLLPSLHNFTYDTDFYVSDRSVTQALEFDVSMYMDSIGMFFGTECAPLGDGNWDMLDNQTQKWSDTGIPCRFQNGWNHLTLQFQRESGNKLLYKSVTLNGVTTGINRTYAPFKVDSSWYGITVNYQMDGDSKQAPNTTYLKNLSLTYK
jgi:hypothetical protein